MINIQPHLDKLEVLKEYMALVINDAPYEIWVDINCVPQMEFSTISLIEMFKEIGVLYYRPINERIEMHPLTFDEYFNHKTNTV